MKTVTKILLVVAAAAAIGIAAAVIVTSLTVHNIGKVYTFGVKADVTEINWGELQPGEMGTAIFTLLNTGSKSGVLNLTTSSLPQGLALTWNSEGVILPSGESKTVLVTLFVDQNTQPQAFNFDIIITMQEAKQ